ncbi:MAG: hypothetical protein SGILL_007320, partial [Bacillariaceae sp.]
MMLRPTIFLCFAVAPVLARLGDRFNHGGRDLQDADPKMSAKFTVTWLSKLSNVVNQDAPIVTAYCPDDGEIALVETSDEDVICEKVSFSELECTSGNSAFATLDLLDLEDGVNATFSCTGSSEAALLPFFELAEQTFDVNVVGQFDSENIVRGGNEPQMEAYQVCGDELVRTDWCFPTADTLFGYCETSNSCNAVCFGVGCTASCSFTVPAVTTSVTSLSCKTTSVAPIKCAVSKDDVPLLLLAEDALNLYESSPPLPNNDTCCSVTEDLKWSAYKDGYVMVQDVEELPGETAVTYFDEGDYLAFGPIDFGSGNDCASIRVRYSRPAEAHVSTGAWAKWEPTQDVAGVLFRLDSPNGDLAGQLLVNHTSGYEDKEVHIAFSGDRMLYVVGHGGKSAMN